MSIGRQDELEQELASGDWREIDLQNKPKQQQSISKIDMSQFGHATMDDAEPEPEPPAKEPQPAPPQPIYVAPQIDHAALARELASMNRPDPLQEEIKGMLQSGAEKEGIENLMKLLDARDAKKHAVAQQQTQQQNLANYVEQSWKPFADKLDDVEEKVPQLGKVRASLNENAWNTFKTDPEFANDYQAWMQGKAPSNKVVAKAVSKTVDAMTKDLGIAKPAAPVSMQSSKPTAPTGRTAGGGVGQMGPRAQKYFNQMKDGCSDLRALADRARKVYGSQ